MNDIKSRVRKNRHGMTLNDGEVDALLGLFRLLDRGGDPEVLMKSDWIRRFRASLQRIKDGTRMRFGGRKQAVEEEAPPPPTPSSEDDFPDIDGSDGGPSLADRVLSMFDPEEDE